MPGAVPFHSRLAIVHTCVVLLITDVDHGKEASVLKRHTIIAINSLSCSNNLVALIKHTQSTQEFR